MDDRKRTLRWIDAAATHRQQLSRVARWAGSDGRSRGHPYVYETSVRLRAARTRVQDIGADVERRAEGGGFRRGELAVLREERHGVSAAACDQLRSNGHPGRSRLRPAEEPERRALYVSGQHGQRVRPTRRRALRAG